MLAYFVCPWVIPPCILYYHLSGDDSRHSLSRHWIKRGSAERVVHRTFRQDKVSMQQIECGLESFSYITSSMNSMLRIWTIYIKIFTSRLATVISAYYFIHIRINFDLFPVPENNLRYIYVCNKLYRWKTFYY